MYVYTDKKWKYTFLGVELFSLVVAFFTGIISTTVCCKLQQKQPQNQVSPTTCKSIHSCNDVITFIQPTIQFLNPTYQGDTTDKNSKAQSDNSLIMTQNINQEITHSHSSLTTDSH